MFVSTSVWIRHRSLLCFLFGLVILCFGVIYLVRCPAAIQQSVRQKSRLICLSLCYCSIV
ncbi:hypothetical protein GLYMA_04G086100v4 [Glycine max]|uniref:Uncharacterized protein n=1 Tax=Glycine max TaxID=3847 RepID=K7KIY1_SOYBN|nr:hypothetical protein JHK85_009698 [Glycine max]KAH1110441.1 hypothetical protein GYH30_009352 [Glycine max]KRH62094.1 hypothetical protein GLYMA_04G086100v4 [Glycine max]